jgi:hypothetical protein
MKRLGLFHLQLQRECQAAGYASMCSASLTEDQKFKLRLLVSLFVLVVSLVLVQN